MKVKKLGRPKVYKEPRRLISLMLPESLITRIKELAEVNQIDQTKLIYQLIIKALS